MFDFRTFSARAQQQRSGKRTCRLEGLERRDLMAANLTASLDAARVLHLEGTDQADVINLRQADGSISVDGIQINDQGILRNSVAAGSVDRIEIKSLGGDDVVRLNWAGAIVDKTATIHGGEGNDMIFGGKASDKLFGDSGDDYLAGGDGNDRLSGGFGYDALEGGEGLDRMTGDAGADRFLTRTGDVIEDLANEDAQVVFSDSRTGTWTDDEIKAIDGAFALLVNRTGNTHLLKDPVTSNPIQLVRVDDLGEYAGLNHDPEQPYTEHLWNKDIVHNRSPYRRIELDNKTFAGDPSFITIHELAHNWESAKEIGRVLPQLEPLWDAFQRIYDQAKATNNVDNFFRDYSMGSAQEDFADSLAALLTGNTSSNPFMVQRYGILNTLLDGLKVKQGWDGHADAMQHGPSIWDQGKDAVLDFFAKLDPTQWKLAMSTLDGQRLADVISGLNVSQLGRLLPKLDSQTLGQFVDRLGVKQLIGSMPQLNGSTFQAIAGRLNAATLANVLEGFDGASLKRALGQLNTNQIAEVFKKLDVPTLHAALDRLNPSRLAEVVEHLNAATLKKALGQLSVSSIASLFDKLDHRALDSALNCLSSAKIADVLERVNGATLKSALSSLQNSEVATVLEKLNTRTLEQALDRLTSSRLAKVLEQVNGGTLEASLKRLSVSRIADALERFDRGTLEAAIKRINTSQMKQVVQHLDKQTLQAAKKYLERIDPKSVGKVFENVGNAVSGGIKNLGKKVGIKW
jgi:Mg/Co/Ni transporter MgtE